MNTGTAPCLTRIHRRSRVGVLFVFAAIVTAANAFAGITTFAGDCVTPKTVFSLGDAVCAKADNLSGFRFAWSNADRFIVQKTDLTSNAQFDSFALPSTAQSSIAGLFVANNLGTWRVAAITSRSSVKTETFFTVKDPNSAHADLEIVTDVAGGDAPVAGVSFQYVVTLTNLGPDDASNTHLVDNQFSNASFNSLTQSGGPAFSCNGADCTISSFPAGGVARFLLNFSAGAAGAIIENTASVSSDTIDVNLNSNSSASPPLRVTTSGPPPTCNLQCPNDTVVSANTTSQGVRGAFVVLPPPDASGTCGPVTLTPASGSFFSVGTTTVSASASGEGFCSFTVTVIDTPPPTISCPPGITVTANPAQLTAFVPDPNAPASNPGTATASGSNVSVTGDRSDDQALSDAYPIGLTLVTWTATDEAGRSISCVQRITVVSPDAPAIHCPSDKTFTAPAGSCEITVSADDIGVPSATGPDVSVTARRSDDQALTAPYPAGTTVITWTATNLLGAASCTQRINVRAIDIDPPVLTAPSDVTVVTNTCSAVLDDELGVASATDNNCSQPVSITRSGVPANFVFLTGMTTITYTATDSAGNVARGVQHVTVLESPSVRPTISAPPDVTVNMGANATTCGAVVFDSTLGTATASDNCPGVTVSRAGIPAGNLFPVGETFVSYIARDASGNTASATQKVTVVDNTPPAVTAPRSVTLFTGVGSTTCDVHVDNLDASLGTGTATDNCSVGPVTRSGVPAGNNFLVGTTPITYSATDVNGNAASATQLVVVVDKTPPTITCTDNLTLEPTCPSGAVATWTAPMGVDNCPGATTTQSSGPASGSVFAIGATTAVTYTAFDAAGNQASCTFTVTVLTVRVTIEKLRANVDTSNLNGPTKQGLIPKLDSALAAMDKNNVKQACQMIGNFTNSVQIYLNHGDISASQGQDWLNTAAHIANALGCTNNPCS